MSPPKPVFEEYPKWLEKTKATVLPKNYETYFNTVTTKMKADCFLTPKMSPF
jgi:hypothetical protein